MIGKSMMPISLVPKYMPASAISSGNDHFEFVVDMASLGIERAKLTGTLAQIDRAGGKHMLLQAEYSNSKAKQSGVLFSLAVELAELTRGLADTDEMRLILPEDENYPTWRPEPPAASPAFPFKTIVATRKPNE